MNSEVFRNGMEKLRIIHSWEVSKLPCWTTAWDGEHALHG